MVAPVVTTFSPTNRSHDTRQRDLLFFFSGTANSCTRRLVISNFAHRHSDRYVVTEEPIAKMEWARYLHRSKFCLVPDGFSAISARLFEVLLHGCVPVIISEAFHPPFEDMINWREIAIFMRREQIPYIEQHLDLVGSEYFILHRKISQVSKAFDVGSAAFWLALFSSIMRQVDHYDELRVGRSTTNSDSEETQ